ncbi:carbamoyl-phosphate synthase (glutamine-hydrolyzing) large subunit [Candidatus Roizmanbacteria bacterium]|nr:carbamoyl-phosphate synthase (glutamine-hydrolyzing) large subunit [Candidatus Roizmanbacteria bacterium]
MQRFQKVLILGSGPLKIGQAGEFDYSGSQAIKALKEEGIRTVLVNPNIATIQTSKNFADTVYFLPITDYFVEKIIKKEKPDGILLSFGGQTALNCGVLLYQRGVFQKHRVPVLGSPIESIILTEDRDKFAKHLIGHGIPTPKSKAVTSVNQAVQASKRIGFPVMIRAAYTLGGQRSGIAHTVEQLKQIVRSALAFSPQVLIEQYLHHFKEIEYEVVRDNFDNCVTVCNMENMDPMGIHTGDSIVVAPSQTLTNFEYHSLRDVSIKIVRSLGIVGECNVQFALKPKPENQTLEYYVIEVNARLSRSSALASKATGYPLAYIAAKLALGRNLMEIKNQVTQKTQSFFEPALDYIVVKIPRWDIEKFKGAEEKIDSGMKSVGEVMGIGRTFEEAYQKAIRMIDLDLEGATVKRLLKNGRSLSQLLEVPTPKRIFAISEALKKNTAVKKLYYLTGIDPWFLYRIKNIIDLERKVPKNIKKLRPDMLRQLKQLGFSDKRIGELVGTTGLRIRTLRKKHKIIPAVFQIDTLSGEFPAKTNYLYFTYNGSHHDVKPFAKHGVIVLGNGPYRIGSSVEFDWTSVNTAFQLKHHKKHSIIVNCNPETVSTDYDISDRLYFEELTFERIADIYDFENPYGIIVSVGGQTPNNRARALYAYGCKILGTNPKSIDRAEDRSKFSKLLDQLDIVQPPWNKFTSLQSALIFCQKVGFPVLIRPSFVLSGTLMRICHNREELTRYIRDATLVSKEYPITVSRFIEDAKEIELDAVSEDGRIITSVISEHVENAGVHSGDATIVFPPQKIFPDAKQQIHAIGRKLALALKITGPFNIQFLLKNNNVFVIEINLRASRTFPFISKVTGIDFMKLAVDSFFRRNKQRVLLNSQNSIAVKVPQFSFSRLTGADPILQVEMASTGEVACFGEDIEEAFLKGELAVGERIPTEGIFLSIQGEENRIEFLHSAKLLTRLKLPLFATEKTAAFLRENRIPAKTLYKIHERKSPNILECFQRRRVDLAINIVDLEAKKEIDDHYLIRRAAIDYNITLFTNLKKAELFIKSVSSKKLKTMPIKSWDEYLIHARLTEK